MRKLLVISCAGLCFLLAGPAGAQPPEATPGSSYPEFTYEEWMRAGRRALLLGHYDKARQYFQNAREFSPRDDKPRKYLNFLKRIEEGRVAPIELKDGRVITFPRQAGGSSPRISGRPAFSKPSLRAPEPAQPTKTQYRENRDRIVVSPSDLSEPVEFRILLDDELWSRQPNMDLVIERGQAIIFEGRNIERSLILTEGFVEAERMSADELRVAGINKGMTFFHLWDVRGRWTFHIQVDHPRRLLRQAAAREREEIQSQEDPFRVSYVNNWSSYYQNDNFRDLERQTLTFSQTGSFVGPTPYGKTDGFVTANKFDLSTEITGYGGGLANGHVGNFRDFAIRGGDTSRRFSELSLPGKYFRGGYLDAYAFDRKINYTYLRGKDRSVFNFVSPGTIDEKKSYIEGAQITLWPDGPHKYSLNFARGFGEARESFLKEQVTSVETSHRFGRLRLDTEAAHDESASGKIARTLYEAGDFSMRVNFRDIDNDFVTLSSIPSGRGEIGGQVNMSYHPGRFSLSSSLDVFQDRFLSNAEHPDDLNMDYSAQMTVPLTERLNWRTSAFYVDTPGQLSPRTSIRGNSQLTQSFRVWQDQLLSVFVGGSTQQNRFEQAPLSEYDRYGYTAGIRVPVVRGLDIFSNYEYGWVDAIATGEQSNPNPFASGFNLSHNFTPRFSGRASVTYRNEEGAGSAFSFLAGEDSVTGNLGFSFRPVPDTELFASGRLRTVWSETQDDTSFAEADLRFGVRTSWNLPFRWSKSGNVGGLIYKDLNKNQRHDDGEPGIPGIRVRVGHTETVTDEDGEYYVAVNAQSVLVSIDVDSIPEGFIIVTALTKEVDLIQHDWQLADFGLTTQSGIYGVVYYDRNANGKLDGDDEFVPRVKLTLDGIASTQSDFEGAYFFENVRPGEHEVALDINTIPLKYLPTIKARTPLTLEEGATYILHVPLKLQGASSSAQ